MKITYLNHDEIVEAAKKELYQNELRLKHYKEDSAFTKYIAEAEKNVEESKQNLLDILF